MKLNNSCRFVKARALNLMNGIDFGQPEQEFSYTHQIKSKEQKANKSFEYWSDGFWYIMTKRKIKRILTNDHNGRNRTSRLVTNINNMPSNYRKKIKVIKKRIDDFLKATENLNCDDCIHINKYYLTNKCDEHFKPKHLV